jgi:hypothetical protein
MLAASLPDPDPMLAAFVNASPCQLPTLLASLQPLAPLLDALADVVFFIKDDAARYAFVNTTLARRCGFKTHQQLLGLTSRCSRRALARCTPNRTARS